MMRPRIPPFSDGRDHSGAPHAGHFFPALGNRYPGRPSGSSTARLPRTGQLQSRWWFTVIADAPAWSLYLQRARGTADLAFPLPAPE
jgi:hypothetical protein